MCGRYYVDDDTAREIGKLVRQADEKMHRAVIPAAWFYEWNRDKQKVTFYREGQSAIFMAGCYKRYEDGDRFVILTTGANAGEFLRKSPPLLESRAEYEQMSLDYF